MNILKALALILCGLAVSVLSASTTRADERFMPYIDWIVEKSDLEYNGEPLPTLEVVPYALLQIIVFGELTVAKSEQTGTTLPNVKAAYDHDRNVMLFPDTTDPWSNEDTIVHELFHYLQYVNLGEPDCIQSYERPAYEAHWAWVMEQGLADHYEEPNWLFVYMISLACQPEYIYR